MRHLKINGTEVVFVQPTLSDVTRGGGGPPWVTSYRGRHPDESLQNFRLNFTKGSGERSLGRQGVLMMTKKVINHLTQIYCSITTAN